jgi:pilus assembly protein Flp/PilA
MYRVFEKARQFVREEDGPTAVEYAVMLALIVVVCITAITALGTNANQTFNNTNLNIAAGNKTGGSGS